MTQATPFITVQSLVDYIEQDLLKYTVVLQHIRAGTIDELYATTLKFLIDNMLMIIARRTELNLDNSEEHPQLTVGTSYIAGILAAACDRTLKEVTDDITLAIHNFPTDDVSKAAQLRHSNRLH